MTVMIANLLKQRNMTQTQLADAVGLSRGHISLLASGKKTPSLATARRIANVLKVGVDDILPGEFAYSKQQKISSLDTGGLAEPGNVAPLAQPGDSTALRMARHIAPSARTPQTYQVTKDLPTFQIQKNDTLVVDLMETPRPGNIVIATLVQTLTGSAHTEVLRWTGTNYLSGNPASPLIHDTEKLSVSRLAVVLAIVRDLTVTTQEAA